MSNVYEVEPSTSGKVLLHTTYGPLDVELWCRECPLHTRIFIQLCLEGFFDNQPIPRLSTGLLECGPFETCKAEYHTRLKWTRRGLVGAMDGPFFITMEELPELYKQATLFGKVVGETVYNLVRIGELETDKGGMFMHPPIILRTEVVINPFDDIIPREFARPKVIEKEKEVKVIATAIKNKKTLSFDNEDEPVQMKIKSSHEVLVDPSLAKQAVQIESSTKTSEIENNSKIGKAERSSTSVDTPNTLEELKELRESGINKIQDKIAQVQEELRKMHDPTTSTGQSSAPKATTRADSLAQLLGVKKPLAPLTVLSTEQRAAYKNRKTVMGKRRAGDEMDTLLALNNFREKLKVLPGRDVTVVSEVIPAEKLEICKLHGLVGCESCRDTFGGGTEQMGTEEGWLMHRLVFDKDAGYREVRADLDQLQVIDPRDRDKSRSQNKPRS